MMRDRAMIKVGNCVSDSQWRSYNDSPYFKLKKIVATFDFPPLCPDFVVELCSPTDNIKTVREKMAEYMVNGARLGWLIDPETRTVEIYEPGEAVEILYNPQCVAGDPVLPGFILEMQRVWG